MEPCRPPERAVGAFEEESVAVEDASAEGDALPDAAEAEAAS
jgi:hypothetical protein